MQSRIRLSSSILAIAGGVLFLVLPGTFASGTVSIFYQPPFRCPPGSLCPAEAFRPIMQGDPMPGGIVLISALLGVIGILLGLRLWRLGWRPTTGVAVGLAVSLGSVAFLFATVTLYILGTFTTSPQIYLLFPETSIVAMVLATGLFSCALFLRRRDAAAAMTS